LAGGGCWQAWIFP